MGYYIMLRKNKTISFIASWVELEDIMLSLVSQKERDKNRMVFHINEI